MPKGIYGSLIHLGATVMMLLLHQPFPSLRFFFCLLIIHSTHRKLFIPLLNDDDDVLMISCSNMEYYDHFRLIILFFFCILSMCNRQSETMYSRLYQCSLWQTCWGRFQLIFTKLNAMKIVNNIPFVQRIGFKWVWRSADSTLFRDHQRKRWNGPKMWGVWPGEP